MSLTTGLGLIFVTLKLLGVINWSWWLVTLPFTIGIFFVILIIILKAIAIWLE